MKILAVADEESRSLWDFYDRSKLEGVELILSCGDLQPEYLEFLVTMSNATVLYIHGNHDSCYDEKPPEGCICIENKIYTYKGVCIFGLGGSMKYNAGEYQYTEKEMRRRILRNRLKIMRNKGFDVLLAHSPAAGINDTMDISHRGFQCFTDVIQRYQPKYFIHGHVHKSYGNFVREQKIGETTVINAFEKYIFSID